MTYRQLRKYLQEMSDSDLDQDATVYDRTEDVYRLVNGFKQVDEQQDVLDEGHHVMTIGEGFFG